MINLRIQRQIALSCAIMVYVYVVYEQFLYR